MLRTSHLFALLLSGVGLLASSPALAQPAAAPAVTLDQTSPVTAPEGHLRLSWDGPGDLPGLRFELERSPESSFREATRLDVGTDRASYISGLVAGANHFRVRAVTASGEPGPWSPPLVVQVEYPSRRQVRTLMAVGAVLLVGTVLLVLTGHGRRPPRPGDAGRD
jgi:hypothetical protein